MSASLTAWSPSIELLVRRTPSAAVVPALVSGALSADALESHLIKWIKDGKDRDWAGATLQILFKKLRGNRLSVCFGPRTPGELSAIQDGMLALLEARPDLLP